MSTSNPFDQRAPRAPWSDYHQERFYRELLDNTQARLRTLTKSAQQDNPSIANAIAQETIIATWAMRELEKLQQRNDRL